MLVTFTNSGNVALKAGTNLDALMPDHKGIDWDLSNDLAPGKSVTIHAKLAWPGEQPTCKAEAFG